MGLIIIAAIIGFLVLYWYFPIRAKIILFFVNMVLIDPLPFVDEAAMLLMIYKNYLRIKRLW